LIIGPWPHHVNLTRQLGGIDFGESALIDLRKVQLDWFDFWLKDARNGVMSQPRVDIFTMGVNSWRHADSWPLEETRYVKYFIHSEGKANTSMGDGKLLTASPSREEPNDSYQYDPSDPCPNIFDSSAAPAEAPFDQRAIERRDDVLVYSTPPLGSNLDVTGPVTVKLFASSSARDTDFWAQLTDVFPNGYSMHLTEGIIRGRYRNSLEKQELLDPEAVYEFNIDLWVTSNMFQAEHRIRLDLSSSSFPKYDRNPNTGNEFGKDTAMIVAEQKIYHNAKYASHITLPIVGKSK
jgi:putative CocE/NonD family hydrolase